MAIHQCAGCLQAKNTQDNGNCRPCNVRQDLLRCRRCKDYLPPVSFLRNRTVCDACSRGTGRGRPRKLDQKQVEFARAMIADGMSLSAAARVVRAQRDTLRRRLRAS